MTGGVADTEEDGFVFLARLFERLGSPRKPVHRIVLMLQEVRRLLLGETVGVGMRAVGSGHGRRSGLGRSRVSGRRSEGKARQDQEEPS